MKRCELCSNIARIRCQSDNAILCYDCDDSVHSANFLVGKHSRTLLCRKCQSPTPWTASGLHLGRTATVCVDCVNELRLRSENRDVNDGETADDDDTESSGESETDGADAEIQMVPWLSVASPPVSASSTSDEFCYSGNRISTGGFRSPIKRERLLHLCSESSESEEDAVCSSEGCNSRRTEMDFRALKVMRLTGVRNEGEK